MQHQSSVISWGLCSTFAGSFGESFGGQSGMPSSAVGPGQKKFGEINHPICCSGRTPLVSGMIMLANGGLAKCIPIHQLYPRNVKTRLERSSVVKVVFFNVFFCEEIWLSNFTSGAKAAACWCNQFASSKLQEFVLDFSFPSQILVSYSSNICIYVSLCFSFSMFHLY